jgi:hypothetical protein
MKAKDLLTITTVALGTAALAVAAFSGGSMEAGNGADGVAAQITRPKLLSHGVEITLASTDNHVFKAGDEPTFDLNAVNTTPAPETVCIRLVMNASSFQDMISRVARPAAPIWQNTLTLNLNPGQTKTLPLATHVKIAPNQMVSVLLQEVDPSPQPAPVASSLSKGALVPAPKQSVVALNFSTVVPRPVRGPALTVIGAPAQPNSTKTAAN